ncbi:leucine-rich repeat domain-containing protein [Mycoplasma sp. CSL10166]|uniref:leucine-rich repeat domain-containing protein n=1 Tax=Mycoplasma sp. CSL10166 TaxID=2813825 RepID=UPI00280B7E76|nr:leucine-rich repeat domain-containing protein [Mycoplasma sp. CSL10166]
MGKNAFSETKYFEKLINSNDQKLAIINNILIDGKNAKGKVILPENVTTIGESAFSGNTTLASIDMPEVTTIGDSSFSGNTSLKSVNATKVTTIGDYAFEGNTSLTSVNVPEVTTIGDGAFWGDKSLTNVSMSNVTTIGDYAFLGNRSLTSIVISKVTTIGKSAFWNTSLIFEKQKLPENITRDHFKKIIDGESWKNKKLI